MSPRSLLLVLWVLAGAAPSLGAELSWELTLAGVLARQASAPADEAYGRLRASWAHGWHDGALRLEADLEALGGSAARLPLVRRAWQGPPSFADATRTWMRPRWLGRATVHRAEISQWLGPARVRVGRTALVWGQGKLWPILDRLVPVPPTALEPEQRPGMDGAVAELSTPTTRVLIAAFPGHGGRHMPPSGGVRVALEGETFMALTALQHGPERLLAAETSIPWGEQLLRATVARVRRAPHLWWEALFGADGRWERLGLDWTIEVFHDGAAGLIPPDLQRLSGVARTQWGVSLGLEPHPLWRLSGSALLAGRNRAVIARASYSAADEAELTFMGLFTTGPGYQRARLFAALAHFYF